MSESIRLLDKKYWSTNYIMYDTSSVLSSILSIDKVIASGENDNGIYIHLNSGLLICFKQVAYNIASASECAEWGSSGNYSYGITPTGASDNGFELGAPAKSFSTVPFMILSCDNVSGIKPVYTVHDYAGLATGSHLGVGNVIMNQAGASSGYLNIIAIGMAA